MRPKEGKDMEDEPRTAELIGLLKGLCCVRKMLYVAGPRTSSSSPEHDEVDWPKKLTRLDRLRAENK